VIRFGFHPISFEFAVAYRRSVHNISPLAKEGRGIFQFDIREVAVFAPMQTAGKSHHQHRERAMDKMRSGEVDASCDGVLGLGPAMVSADSASSDENHATPARQESVVG
jgi:hypothetical protein